MVRSIIYFCGAALVTALIVIAVSYHLISKVPSKKDIRGCLTTEMYKVHLCPGSVNYTRIGNISPYLQKAVVLTEDSAFFQHNGFDFKELKNSFEKNVEEKRFARGGSTISQQLAKNMFLSTEKTISRKVLEALITMQIEKYLSKKEILERYLNVVEFGDNIYGVKQASQYYFHKAPAELNMVESSFLAFLLPNPKAYSISFRRKSLTPFAYKRLRQILDRMYQYKKVSEEEYNNGLAEFSNFLRPQTEDQAFSDSPEEFAPIDDELDEEIDSQPDSPHSGYNSIIESPDQVPSEGTGTESEKNNN